MVDPTEPTPPGDRVEPADRRRTRTASARAIAIAVAVVVALAGAIPFFTVTTFFGDDHVFLAFARYATNPLIAFVRDQHGGEYYRPLPMLLWWVLGRISGGSTWPFAALAFVLHLLVAIEVGALLISLRRDRLTAALAATLFFVAPFTREAAYWYAASTDLLATVFGLGTVLALLRGQIWGAILLFAAACWSKESAIVVPVLGVIALRTQDPAGRWSVAARRAVALLPVAGSYVLARWLVLHGVGGSGDETAPVATKLVQIGAGLVHVVPGTDILAEPVAWTIGAAVWIVLLFRVFRVARSQVGAMSWAPLAWITFSLLPVLAAPWIVGARYFYLAAAGLAWLAAEALGSGARSALVMVGVIAALSGLDLSQTIARRADVTSYRQRLAAARRAVTSGLSEGHTTFHIASGIKDLDLAVKEDPRLASFESALVIVTDVPASFIALPEARAQELDFLLARPPLPPAGAYRFGTRRIVGLARRGDDPTLDEVLSRLPAMRFIRLRPGPGGRIVPRDVTEMVRGSDADPP